jgi:hypothetical protein
LLNPYTYQVNGDLSKADIVALTLLCRGKNVIEFGIGGSTILLSKVANKVITYEHDMDWVNRVRPSLGDNVEIRMIDKGKTPEEGAKNVIGLGSPCDVCFIDGHSHIRSPALMEFWPYIKEYAVLHDARMTYAGNCVKKFIDAFTDRNEPSKANPGLPDNPFTGSLERIEWNWLESNMVVLKKRNCTLKYENWKVTENA